MDMLILDKDAITSLYALYPIPKYEVRRISFPINVDKEVTQIEGGPRIFFGNKIVDTSTGATIAAFGTNDADRKIADFVCITMNTEEGYATIFNDKMTPLTHSKICEHITYITKSIGFVLESSRVPGDKKDEITDRLKNIVENDTLTVEDRAMEIMALQMVLEYWIHQ